MKGFPASFIQENPLYGFSRYFRPSSFSISPPKPMQSPRPTPALLTSASAMLFVCDADDEILRS